MLHVGLHLWIHELAADKALSVECREDFGFLRRYSCVVLDERGHDTTDGLDTERERGDVEQIQQESCRAVRIPKEERKMKESRWSDT